MAIVINGSGTVTGLAVGGLPDDTVDEGSLANSINTSIGAKLPLAGGTMTGNLEVTGSAPTIRIKGTVNDSATSGRIEFKENDNTNGFDLRYDGSANNFIINSNNVANALVIARTTGKIGIGTAAPAEMLHIESAQNSTKLRIKNTKSGETVGAELEMTNEDGTWQLGTGRGSLHAGTDTDFHIYGNGTRMWIKRSNGSAYFANNIHAGDGISFNGETDAAHLLDDYEEGNWTPSWTMDSGSVALTNGTKATYTKIGRTVTVNMYIKVASISSPSGACYVNGLPFVVTDSRQAAAATWASNMTSGSNGSVQARTLGTETRFRVQKFLNGSDSPFANTIAANTELILSMTYNAA